MKKYIIKSIILLLFSFNCTLLSAPKLSNEDKILKEYYLAESKKLMSQDTIAIDSIDFRKFRLGGMINSEMDLKYHISAEVLDEMDHAIRIDNDEYLLKAVNKILAINYTFAMAHVYKFSLEKKTNPKISHFHKLIYQKLVKSIFDSGDGKSTSSAFEVFFVYNQRPILVNHRLRKRGQKLLTIGNKKYDEIKCLNEKGKKEFMYFDVSEMFDFFRRTFGEKINR